MKDKDAADIAKALSHPLRLEILREMRKRENASPNDLSQDLNEPLGNISYHVTTLREAGAVEIVEEVPGAAPSNIATRSPPRRGPRWSVRCSTCLTRAKP